MLISSVRLWYVFRLNKIVWEVPDWIQISGHHLWITANSSAETKSSASARAVIPCKQNLQLDNYLLGKCCHSGHPNTRKCSFVLLLWPHQLEWCSTASFNGKFLRGWYPSRFFIWLSRLRTEAVWEGAQFYCAFWSMLQTTSTDSIRLWENMKISYWGQLCFDFKVTGDCQEKHFFFFFSKQNSWS